MHHVTQFEVVELFRNTRSVIAEGLTLEELSHRYRKTLCGCDPLACVYGDNDERIVEYVFFETDTRGVRKECLIDPRLYVGNFDGPSIEHECPPHRKCLIERSGVIDEYEEEFTLLI